MIGTIPVGAVLARRYFTVPNRAHPNIGTAYETPDAAAIVAFEQWADANTDLPIHPPVVDQRWVMEHPERGRFDVQVERTTLAPAQTGSAYDSADRRRIARTEMATIRARMARTHR